ncbi:Hypothetical protein PHPALM_5751, partial [Phytophthora palmivora]
MNLTAFVPTNTQKARTTVIRAFKRILELQGVSMEYYHASILNDLVSVLSQQRINSATILLQMEIRMRRPSRCGLPGCCPSMTDVALLRAYCGHRLRAEAARFSAMLTTMVLEEPETQAQIVALAAREGPCTSLLGHLRALNPEAATPLNVGVPLHDLLAAEPASLQVAVMPTPASATPLHCTSLRK